MPEQLTDEQAFEMRQALYSMMGAISAHQQQEIWPWAAGSLAARDAAETEEGMIQSVLDQAEAAITSAGTHFAALLRTLNPPILTIPPWTIARTILEASARSAWLLDPDILARERVSKGVVLLLQDREEHFRIFGHETPLQWKNEHRDIIDEVKNFVKIERSHNGRVTRIGEIPLRIKVTTIVKMALGAERDYRLLSALTHQRSTRQKSMTMHKTGMELEMSMNAPQYVSLLAAPLRWYATAVWRHFIYCGYNTGVISNIFTNTKHSIAKYISQNEWAEWRKLADSGIIPPYIISAQIVGMEERFWE